MDILKYIDTFSDKYYYFWSKTDDLCGDTQKQHENKLQNPNKCKRMWILYLQTLHHDNYGL